MTDIEKQKFQIRTIIVNAAFTLALTVSLTVWGYNRTDGKAIKDSIDCKVEKADFIKYQEGVSAEFRQVKIENNDNWKTMDGKIDKIYEYLLNNNQRTGIYFESGKRKSN